MRHRRNCQHALALLGVAELGDMHLLGVEDMLPEGLDAAKIAALEEAFPAKISVAGIRYGMD